MEGLHHFGMQYIHEYFYIIVERHLIYLVKYNNYEPKYNFTHSKVIILQDMRILSLFFYQGYTHIL